MEKKNPSMVARFAARATRSRERAERQHVIAEACMWAESPREARDLLVEAGYKVRLRRVLRVFKNYRNPSRVEVDAEGFVGDDHQDSD